MDVIRDMARDPAASAGSLSPPGSASGVASPGAAAPEHVAVLTEVLRERIDSAERVGGGRNSRVYRVRCATGDYAAKFYFGRTADGRDRSQVEYSAFDFLWRHGVRCIPRPLASDAARQVAVYEFIDGEPVEASAVAAGDIEQLGALVRQLKEIAADPSSRDLGPAAEAFFSVGGVVGNITDRYRRIASLETRGRSYDALRQFLAADFEPAFAQLGDWVRKQVEGRDAELPVDRRTLSPSDLGFHNSLRRGNGRLVFLDFEYFGWDDPAKMLSDALLHPRMRLAAALRAYLAGQFASIFDRDPAWRRRVETVYPLFGLKWCMILLNEFRPEQLERRRFVDHDLEEAYAVQMRQLDAARRLLQRITAEHPRFAFWKRNER